MDGSPSIQPREVRLAVAQVIAPKDEAFVNPDFIALAKSFGAEAERVDSPDQISGVVEKALTRNRLTVIEVLVRLTPPSRFGLRTRVRYGSE